MKYAFLLLLSFNLYAQDPSLSFLTLDSALTNKSNSVVREELITVDVTKPSQMTTKRSRTITVLNDSGDDEVNSYLFYDDHTVIKNVELIIYDAFGKEIEHYKKRDFNDVSVADGFSLYTDNRRLYVNHIPKSYPYTATFISEVKSNTTAFLPRWYPIGGYASSTEKSVYTLFFDPENKPDFKKSNLESYNINVEEGASQITFTATMLPAISYENHAPRFISFAPQVMFGLKTFSLKGVMGNGASWNEFGSWMDEQLLKGTEELPAETISEINSLVTPEMSDIDKARVVYQYLQDKVRYINVSIGIGGWKPMPASEVDRLSYGDCKALTNYTKSLLKAVGVPSYYTVLYSDSSERDFTNDLVAMQGNHAILAIPDGEDFIWLECTSQDIPFGHVPNSNDNRDVLIVTEEGGKLVRTKTYETEDNLQANNAKILILDTGEIQASFNRVSKGLQYDNVYHLDRETRENQERYYKEKWDYINGVEVSEIVFDNNRTAVVFTENLKVISTNYTSFAGDNMLLALNVFNQLDYVPPRFKKRTREVEVSVGFTDVDTYDIVLPSGYTVDSLPSDVEIVNQFGSYTISAVLKEDASIEYTRKLVLNKGVYPPETYEEYRNFFKQIAKKDKSKILLTKN
ncbi:transglutaminase-like enzyme; cysteine protease [unidentified eubacterium SCB49]|nr:transglutaminase-like enzyme; cysteine protease [unidentified eubacterium SCB49]